MAHELETVNVGGRNIVEAMYANSPAWHGLGTIFDQGGNAAPDSETAMRLAHLDWMVTLEPLKLATDGLEVPGRFATVRSEPRRVLGIVGTEYKVFQNAEGFSFLDNLVMDGIMRYESAMALRGGSRIVLLARMPSVDTVAEGDEQLRYVMCSTSHDGSAAIDLMPTSVRVVCANTRRLALQKEGHLRFSIRHSGDLKSKMEAARVHLQKFDAAFTKQNRVDQVLATRYASEQECREFVETLFPAPPETAGKRAKANRDEKIRNVKNAFRTAYTPASVKGTWWHLLNAVTYTVDHGTSSRGRNDALRRENTFSSVMDGTGADLKDRAYKLVAERAGVNLLAV